MKEPPKSLRICIVISTFFPYIGGAETQTLSQCQRLLHKGHKAQIITFRHQYSWRPYEVYEGVPVVRVAGTFLGKREQLPRFLQRLLFLLAMLTISWALWQRRSEFDILQVRKLSALVLPLAIVCWLAKKPLVVVLSSTGTNETMQTSSKTQLLPGPLDPTLPWLHIDTYQRTDGDLHILQRGGKLLVWCTRKLLKHIHAGIIILSTRTSHYLKEFAFDHLHTELIPNGVDIVRFHPLSSAQILPQHYQQVVCVSKLRHEKGIDVLLQAWRLVCQQQPDARLCIVGDGPLQHQLKQLANALALTESVTFEGTREDIPAQIHRGMINVLPSRWEGMPNALLEAMACGKACVATRVSGSEDLIAHDSNGLLVEPEDYTSLAQALLTLLNDPLRVQRYGAMARATIEERYELDYITDKYIEIYRRLSRDRQHAQPMVDYQVPYEEVSERLLPH